MQLQQMLVACNREVPGVSPEDHAVLQRQNMQNRQAFAQSCTDPQSQAGLQKFDACLARHDAVLAQEDRDADARRKAEAPKAETLKADATFTALRDRYRQAHGQETMACESASNARADHSPNLATWEQQCDGFKHRADVAAADIRARIQRSGIDLRDGAALGLW
jgi:hypothetical protein